MTDPRAIGVFDSGIGGLTVLRALIEQLPAEPTVYLGDTARVPYGTRSPDVVTRYALNNARTLLATSELKLLIVACNTASAVALPALAVELDVPVLGVIAPGARAAAQATRGGAILVLGTAGTVRSLAYPRALEAEGVTGDVQCRACPLLVPLVEEGWTQGEVTDRVLDRYLADLDDEVDTVLLGCTHYPLLREAVAEAVERARGEAVPVVDGAEATALQARQLLERAGRLAPPSSRAQRRFLVTDAPDQLARLAPRFLGQPVSRDDVELVDVLMTAT